MIVIPAVVNNISAVRKSMAVAGFSFLAVNVIPDSRSVGCFEDL